MAFAIGTTSKEGTLSLSRASQPTYSSEYADDLTSKYNIAMGETSPGEPSIRSAIVQGNTQRLEELMNQRRQVELAGMRNELIQQIAVEANGTPSDIDLEVVRGLSMVQMQDPNLGVILEEEYAKKVTNYSASILDEEFGVVEEAMLENQDASYEVMDRVQNIATRNMIANNLYNEVQTKFDQSNLFQKGKAWLQTFIPGRSWYVQNTFIDSAPVNRLNLPGNTMMEQVAYLYTLPPAQFKAVLEEGIRKNVSSDAYLDILTFLEAVQSFSPNDQQMNNIFGALDVADVAGAVGVARLFRGMSKTPQIVNNSVRNLVQSATDLHLNARAAKSVLQDALKEGKLPSFNIRNITEAERL